MRYRCEILNHGIDGYEVWLHGRNQGRSGVKSIVLSRIDYASQLWSPYKKSYICALEKIQRSFTKYIAGY